MGDAANQVRGKVLKDEDDFKRSPKRLSYLSFECHGKKLERDSPKPKAIPVVYGNSPHNGPHQNFVKNFSPVGRAATNPKDIVKRWSAEEQRSDSDNWRHRRSQNFNRSRNDSTNESGDSYRWQEVGDKRSQLGRPQTHRDAAPGDLSDELPGVSDLHTPTKRERQHSRSEREEDDCLGSPVIDESMLSKKELLGLQQAEERLKRDCIYRLKRRPRKYPTAIYTCKLCDALVDSISSAHKHMKEKRHKGNLKEKREEELLTTLPPPMQPQIQAINNAISKVVQEHGLNEEDMAKRLSTVSAMEEVIKEKLPGCSLRLYGSSCSKMGFRNSDLNIDIQFPVTMNQPDVLLLLQESLKQSDFFTDFEADFHARVPVVVCREKKSDLICKVSAGNENACLTTNLLAALGRKESRLVPLVVTFRYWAKLCGIDRPEEGGLPPYVAALMVVFFLQQRKEPILPVYIGSWIDGFTISKLGQFSLKEPSNEYVCWEYSAVADNENQNSEQCSSKGKVPLFFDTEKQCSASIGQLWVDMLRFYALEFNMADLVVNVRVKEKLSRELKDWPKKRIAIEDPYSVKRNVARSMNSQLVYEYLLHCLKATYKYFAMPQTKSGKSNTLKSTNSAKNATEECVPNALMCSNSVQNISKKLENVTIDHHDASASPVNAWPNHSERSKELGSTVKKKLVYNITYPDVNLEDADCITEEIILDDPEDFFQGSEEPESPQEDSDDEPPLIGNEQQGDYILIDQSYEEDSESGEVALAGNEETDSLSDFEGGIVTDEIGLESRDLYVEKGDLEEEGTEGTDELEETVHDFRLAAVTHSDDDEEDDEEEDEEPNLMLNHGEHLDLIDDLENTYTGSVDDLLSEDDQTEQVSVSSSKDPEIVNEGLAGTLLPKTEDAKKPKPVTESAVKEICMFYEFSKPTFTKGKLPTVVCNLCKKEGHLKKDCPEDFKKIELEALPPLTAKFRQLLDQVCIQCYEDFHPTALEDKAREHIRHDLEDFIRREFKGARLNLFGSSKNGFGFKQSDLDICMTFEGLETAEELDSIKIIEDLARHLRRHQGLRNILPITTAKVPIVKFYHVRSGLEGDISLYNTLALHNTRLLASYAAIDPRVKYLCYIMKVFTKMCDIGDASRGSLSSYAYTLMVLYFLQQKSPPVIPVLQEMYTSDCKREILVDGWNVYFFSQIEELAKYWPEYGKNKESVGELWLGLLRFYTEDFDFKEHVISIRKLSLVTTFKKQWTSKYIVIEDPFDLTHNLGAGLSRKMTNFIMKAFINGRRVFGTPVKGIPKEYPSKMEYFFDPDVLTEGEVAPNDRCCRICGKIGHFMKDCPMRRKVRRRNHEKPTNQRYVDKQRPRKPDDKEMNNRIEGDGSYIDGKQCTTPKKPHQGARSTLEACRDRMPKHSSEKWRRQEELREKRCFICGREGHIKKECPQYKGATGSPKPEGPFGSPSASSPQKHQGRFIQVVPLQDEKRIPKISFSPQSGSLSTKYMTQGKAYHKKAHQEF